MSEKPERQIPLFARNVTLKLFISITSIAQKIHTQIITGDVHYFNHEINKEFAEPKS